MEDTNYQITARPLSTFTTFGEAAPNPPAGMEGKPAAPVDNLTPIMQGLGQLSNTILSFLDEQKTREYQQIATEAEAQAQMNASEIMALSKERKNNQLKYADLVDKGLISDSENPWAKVASMRALATISADLVDTNMKSNLAQNFRTNEGNLASEPEPAVAMAAWMSQRSNPLNLGDEVLTNHYYMTSFEKEFSKVRKRATNGLIELRNQKTYNDTIEAVNALVIKALDQENFDLPEGAVGLDGESIEVPDYKQQVAAIIADPGWRAYLGNKDTTDVVGMMLIDLAKQGDSRAIDALENTKLSSGKTLLASSDKLQTEYALAESTIANAVGRQNSVNMAAVNMGMFKEVENNVLALLESNPRLTPETVASRIEGAEYNSATQVIEVPQYKADGSFSSVKKISFSASKETAIEVRFTKFLEAAKKYSNGNENLEITIAASQLLQQDGETYAPIVAEIKRLGPLLDRGGMLDDADIEAVGRVLSLYRQMVAQTGVVEHYFTEEDLATFYVLDLMERGSMGPLGRALPDDPNEYPQGNIQSALFRIQEMDPSRSRGEDGFTTVFNSDLRAKNIDPALGHLIRSVGEIAVNSGAVASSDIKDFPSTLLDEMMIHNEGNYTISRLLTPNISEDEADAYFIQYKSWLSSLSKKQPEGTLAFEIQTATEEASGLKVGDRGFKEALTAINFISNPHASRGIRVMYGNNPIDPRRNYLVTDFRAEWERVKESQSRNRNKTATKETSSTGSTFIPAPFAPGPISIEAVKAMTPGESAAFEIGE